MSSRIARTILSLSVFIVGTFAASAQSFRVQCPTSTITHPVAANNNAEPTYAGPTTFTPLTPTAGGYMVPSSNVNGAIKCQQVSGGDGYSTMANGTQTFMFSFGPLSGVADIEAGLPGTEFPSVYNSQYQGPNLLPGDPATKEGVVAGTWPTWPTPNPVGAFTFNGAVGLAPDIANLVSIYDIAESTVATGGKYTIYVQANAPLGVVPGQTVMISGTGTGGYDGTYTVNQAPYVIPWPIGTVSNGVTNYGFAGNFNFTLTSSTAGLADVQESATASASTPPVIDGHVDPRQIMDVGVMNGNIPAPLVAFDEDDELFLTLTNVGMIMRPDLFEQHTIHFHGYPNASSVYDGVPDASVAINIGGSFTYYYLAPDAGTYFWHCHITPPEHLQMGMVGQLYVRPRQNRVAPNGNLRNALLLQNGGISPTNLTTLSAGADLRTVCNPAADILCSAVTPPLDSGAVRLAAGSLCSGATAGAGYSLQPMYAYNDGDGSTCYDVEYPLQIHGFDPNFHFVGMTFNPEAFVDMKDKFFLLNGRSYPDTTTPGPMATETSDGRMHYSQPLPSVINIPVGGRALLRIADLDVSEYQTLATLGIPMKEVGFNAKLLRDQAGNNLEFYTNSITLGGGESLDVILDASNTTLYPAGSTFYLYTPNLDHLSNDQENFGGLMTVVHICSSVTGSNTFGNTCN